jgi:hypothetical protein
VSSRAGMMSTIRMSSLVTCAFPACFCRARCSPVQGFETVLKRPVTPGRPTWRQHARPRTQMESLQIPNHKTLPCVVLLLLAACYLHHSISFMPTMPAVSLDLESATNRPHTCQAIRSYTRSAWYPAVCSPTEWSARTCSPLRCWPGAPLSTLHVTL